MASISDDKQIILKKKKSTEKRARGYLILVSGDEEPEIFEVLAQTMTQCQLIKLLLFEEEPKSHGASGSETVPEILKGKRVVELPNIRGSILSRVIEFFNACCVDFICRRNVTLPALASQF